VNASPNAGLVTCTRARGQRLPPPSRKIARDPAAVAPLELWPKGGK
jgi:hypothetical protein